MDKVDLISLWTSDAAIRGVASGTIETYKHRLRLVEKASLVSLC